MLKELFKYLSVSCALIFSFAANGQGQFTRYDTLRGANSKHRDCYNVHYYDLNLTIIPEQKYIEGYNAIHYTVNNNFDTLQLDLFNNYIIDSLTWNDQQIRYRTDSNTIYVIFDSNSQEKNHSGVIKVYYSGSPIETKNPPWDGGVTWQNDSLGNIWSAVTCEGTGASLWWPCKDYLGDEPDSMALNFTVPNGLKCISNGKLRGEEIGSDYTTFHWFVGNPINNYNATFYIGNYVKLKSQYVLQNSLQLENQGFVDYYSLKYHSHKAQEYFDSQVKPMLDAFENYFGEYPFINDGYKIVEAPYWGMEHQSAIAYGNNFILNDFDFDFIIIHESAHEYWGNAVSVKDHGEMWIHEAFATYMEALFLEYRNNLVVAENYLEMQRAKIRNKVPILGPLKVNYDGWPDADMYYKGSWVLHTLRNGIYNDQAWKDLLKDLYQEFKFKDVDTDQIVRFINDRTKFNVVPFFRQYLEKINYPTLHYVYEKVSKKKGILKYRWENVVKDFELPIVFNYSNFLYVKQLVTTEWKSVELKKIDSVEILENKYLININHELK